MSAPRCLNMSKYKMEKSEEDMVDRGPDTHRLKAAGALNKQRIVHKSGEPNVRFMNIPQKSVKFCKDMITSMAELDWKYVFTLIFVANVGSFIFFGMLWQLIAHAHGDLDFDAHGARIGEGRIPCAKGATEFWGFFLLSIELQGTTGYGEKYPTEECPEGIFLFMAQILFSVVLEGALLGIIYVKMAQPQKLFKKFQFSKLATVCQRDGQMCLLFRVADLRNYYQINSKVDAFFCQKSNNEVGDANVLQSEMKLTDEGKVDLIWPVIMCHVIDQDSPLYRMDEEALVKATNFEIVVTLIGSSRNTGQITQARTSYLPSEIMWAHRFENILHYDYIDHAYYVNYDKFDSIYPHPMPSQSSEQLDGINHRSAEGSSLPNVNATNESFAASNGALSPSQEPEASDSDLKLNTDYNSSVQVDYHDSQYPAESQEYDDDDDFEEETDDFDDTIMQSAATVTERGEKRLFNKLRPNVWNAKVVSTPNIWHKE